MDLDKDTLFKIATTHTNVKHIMKDMVVGKETFKDHDERIRELEEQQQFINGKLAVITIFVGTVVTVIINGMIWIWSKVQK